MVIGHPGQIDHVLAVAAAGDADVGLARLAWSVHHAAEDAERHRGLDVLQPLLERFDRADYVEALARAARAGDDPDAAAADTQRLQDLVADPDFFFGLGRERYADGVADAGPQQVADADGGFDRAADQAAGLRNSKVQRTVHLACQLLIGGDREEDVARLHRDLVLAEAVVLE